MCVVAGEGGIDTNSIKVCKRGSLCAKNGLEDLSQGVNDVMGYGVETSAKYFIPLTIVLNSVN